MAIRKQKRVVVQTTIYGDRIFQKFKYSDEDNGPRQAKFDEERFMVY